MPLAVGAAGFGVETTYWYFKDLQLQAAADASANAAALEKRSGAALEQVTAEATSAALTNGYETTGGTITVNSPPKSGTHMTNKAVEVVLTETKGRLFTRLFSQEPVILKARAMAQFEDAGSACVLALHKSASKAALFSGSSTTTLNKCSVMANSVANNAVTVQGTGKLVASCLYSAGGIDAGSGVTLDCAAPRDGMPPVADPYSDLVPLQRAALARILPQPPCPPGSTVQGSVWAGQKS